MRATTNVRAGRIWPAGRRFPTPVVGKPDFVTVITLTLMVADLWSELPQKAPYNMWNISKNKLWLTLWTKSKMSNTIDLSGESR